MIVVRSGRKFEHLATNSMGETSMATPALSERLMYVRGAALLFAVFVSVLSVVVLKHCREQSDSGVNGPH